MKCVCHPGPYHKPECPCQAAYERYVADRLAHDLTTPEEAESVAEELVRAGYRQFSRKYCLVSRDDKTTVELSFRTFEAFRRLSQSPLGG